MRPSLIRRVAFVSFRLATRAARCDENSRRSVQFSSSYRHSTPCSPCCCRSPDARTGGIRRTHPVNDKRPATRLLRPRRADGFHARRPSESPILPDAESSLIQPALRYLHLNLLEGGRCLSAGHLIRIAMRARLSISVRLLAALRPPQACLLAPERARGQAGPPRAYLVQSWAPSASIAKAGAVGLRVHSWASLAVRWIYPRCDGSPCGAMGLACDAIGSQNASSGRCPSRTLRTILHDPESAFARPAHQRAVTGAGVPA